jgi:hypothetical protein
VKRFFTRACAKIGRFFWSWGFLKFILWAVTLIILFYVEEDWRGARTWAATKAEWEAKGESFDYNKFIPPPVPDDENLAALPLFKLEPVEWSPGKFEPDLGNLKRAIRSELPGNDLPSTGNAMRGERPNWEKIRNSVATNYSAAFKGATPHGETLAQFDALYPFISDLRADSAKRPLCRFNLDYTVLPPFERSLGQVATSIRLSKILTFHAILALDHHQSDLALEDIKINYKLLSGTKRDPTLIGGLIAIGINAISNSALYDGLAQHEWSDAQLAEIEHVFKPINFLADYRFAMRSEATVAALDIDAIKNTPRYRRLGMIEGLSNQSSSQRSWNPWNWVWFAWPRGWWDSNKVQDSSFILLRAAAVDPRSHRVYPNVDLELTKRIEQACARWDANAPWNFYFTLASPNLDPITREYAYSQVLVDEARIACALERYRLAHGVYPGALDALAPAYINELPHDIMNGQPYHYQLRSDGTFLLYSVGWNQTNDGGKVVFKKDNPAQVDYTEGDWVWPTPR